MENGFNFEHSVIASGDVGLTLPISHLFLISSILLDYGRQLEVRDQLTEFEKVKLDMIRLYFKF